MLWRRPIFSGCPHDANFKIYYKTHYCCFIFDHTSPMCCVKYWKVGCCIFLQFWISILWTSSGRRGVYRVTSLGRPQDVNLEPLVINLILPNVCLKHWKVNCFIVLFIEATSQRHPINVPKWRPEGDILETSPGRKYWT